MMMSLLFNKIKKVLRLHYHTREEVRQKYLNDAVLRSEVIRLLRA
jgi:hypothetical protein